MERGSQPVRVYIGLGSNLDRPGQQVRQALNELARFPRSQLVARSSLYLSPPVGPQDQPDYVNAVAALDTELTPRRLLQALLATEHAHGRTRGPSRWGPRPLDLDILLYGDLQCHDSELSIPHPEMAHRAFVLIPLSEIAPEVVIPGVGRVRDLVKGLSRSSLTVLDRDP